MTKMYIPQLRDKIQLTADWTFKLYCESRNSSLFEETDIRQKQQAAWQRYRDIEDQIQQLGGKYSVTQDLRDQCKQAYHDAYHVYVDYTFPVGTVLSIDRIYIKNGQTDYNSVTFRLVDPYRKGVRFWAKLADVNTIEFDLLP